jgi:hypothetical protein
VYGKAGKDELVFAFVCRVIGGVMRETEEADACQYFPLDGIPGNTSPKHVERIHDAAQGRERPVFRRQSGPATREWLRQWQDGRA